MVSCSSTESKKGPSFGGLLRPEEGGRLDRLTRNANFLCFVNQSRRRRAYRPMLGSMRRAAARSTTSPSLSPFLALARLRS
jgi:hypothetical protein